MLRTILLLFSSIVFVAMNGNAQTRKARPETAQQAKSVGKKQEIHKRYKEVSQPGTTSTWTADDRQTFVKFCLTESTWTQDSAQNYCSCMQEKIEKLYPIAAEATKLTQEEATEIAKECFTQINSIRCWGEMEKTLFLNECMTGANKSMAPENARSYCSCLLEKLEKEFPNVFSLGQANRELLSKFGEDCKNQSSDHFEDLKTSQSQLILLPFDQR